MSNSDPATDPKPGERFTAQQTIDALQRFATFGEQVARAGAHGGYFSGDGWAARCLRAHIETLRVASSNPVPECDAEIRGMRRAAGVCRFVAGSVVEGERAMGAAKTCERRILNQIEEIEALKTGTPA